MGLHAMHLRFGWFAALHMLAMGRFAPYFYLPLTLLLGSCQGCTEGGSQ